jgi:putative methionine-R-sulfoxide reductase with GAF domain
MGFMTLSSSGSNISSLANVSAHVFHTLNAAFPGSVNWCGWSVAHSRLHLPQRICIAEFLCILQQICRYIANNSERCIELGPFQGRPAVIRIPFDKGVCGACATEQDCIVVPDVHAFPGHIACDAASNRCAINAAHLIQCAMLDCPSL